MNAAARAVSQPLAVAFLVVFFASIASAQGGGPFQCMATSTDGGHVTMYLSQMFPSGGAAASPALNQQWSDYVKGAYRLQNVASAVCRVLPADPAMQQRVQDAYQRAAQGGRLQLVNVNWTPGQNQNQNSAQNSNTNPYAAVGGGDKGGGNGSNAGGKDAPPADNQNQQAAQDQGNQGPQPRASYCFSDQKKPTVYFSDAFDTADIQNPDDWVNAFVRMLVDKYKYKGTVTCNDSDTIFNAQNAIRDLKDTMNGKQLVDTDWSYDPSQAPPPADTPPPAPPKKKTTAKPAPAPQN
jgi:hypothetical protein